MQSPIISVIVPVYKVEKYLRACVDSICGQTFSDFELILVDDGSPDNCGRICDEYANKDLRIRVIHQDNRGISAARNAALSIMRGQYIAFIDSDDFIAADYLDKLYSAIILENADVSMCRRYDVNEGDEVTIFNGERDVEWKVMGGREVTLFRYKDNFSGFSIGAGEKLFEKKIFESLRFPVGKACEDQAVIPFAFYQAKKVCMTYERMYYYRIRRDSASHGQPIDKSFENIEHMNAFIKYMHEKKEKEIEVEAKKHRDKTLALYTIIAKNRGFTEIPDGCRMNELRALAILRKTYPDEKYEWFLSLVRPQWIRFHEYIRKAESIVKR